MTLYVSYSDKSCYPTSMYIPYSDKTCYHTSMYVPYSDIILNITVYSPDTVLYVKVTSRIFLKFLLDCSCTAARQIASKSCQSVINVNVIATTVTMIIYNLQDLFQGQEGICPISNVTKSN